MKTMMKFIGGFLIIPGVLFIVCMMDIYPQTVIYLYGVFIVVISSFIGAIVSGLIQ